jgi:hypothetical protein
MAESRVSSGLATLGGAGWVVNESSVAKPGGVKRSTANLGYQQVTSLAASTALTVPAGATYAQIRAETQDVRWRDDGGAPTAAVGTPLAAGETLNYDGDLSAVRFIEQAASAKLNVSYYK